MQKFAITTSVVFSDDPKPYLDTYSKYCNGTVYLKNELITGEGSLVDDCYCNCKARPLAILCSFEMKPIVQLAYNYSDVDINRCFETIAHWVPTVPIQGLTLVDSQTNINNTILSIEWQIADSIC